MTVNHFPVVSTEKMPVTLGWASISAEHQDIFDTSNMFQCISSVGYSNSIFLWYYLPLLCPVLLVEKFYEFLLMFMIYIFSMMGNFEQYLEKRMFVQWLGTGRGLLLVLDFIRSWNYFWHPHIWHHTQKHRTHNSNQNRCNWSLNTVVNKKQH